VIFRASPIALSGDLLSESFMCTVERIHIEIKKMDDEYLRSAVVAGKQIMLESTALQ
jgi:shikimate O-hydroxycinnamoyltransferase